MKGGMEYIRRVYGVPAYRLRRVIVDGRLGTITGESRASLLIRLDGEKHSAPWHPTWRVVYDQDDVAAAEARGAS